MNCDALAPYYQTLEHLSFGRQLERSRFAFLREAATARRALICGGGDGRFLARLLRLNDKVLVDFVDLSHKMTGIAQRRVAAMGPSFPRRVRFSAGDLCHFQPQPAGYDLIVTNFFLDCFSEEELAPVVSRLAGWAASGAFWMLSDFRQLPTTFGVLWTTALIRVLYAAFRWTTGLRVTRLPNYSMALQRAGFACRWEEAALGGLLHSSLWLAAKHDPQPPLR
jgi:hypothetical protein